MLNDALSKGECRSLQEAERSGRETACFHRGVDGLGNQLTRAGVGRVSLDDDRTACREGRCRVATRR